MMPLPKADIETNPTFTENTVPAEGGPGERPFSMIPAGGFFSIPKQSPVSFGGRHWRRLGSITARMIVRSGLWSTPSGANDGVGVAICLDAPATPIRVFPSEMKVEPWDGAEIVFDWELADGNICAECEGLGDCTCNTCRTSHECPSCGGSGTVPAL